MNDNSLGIREAKGTVAQSELDKVMQVHIDSGQFTKEELAEMKKAEANKLKEAKKAIAQEEPVAEKVGSGTVLAPKKSTEMSFTSPPIEDIYIPGINSMDQGITGTGRFLGAEQIERDAEIQQRFHKSSESVKKKVLDKFGTSNAAEILAMELGDDAFHQIGDVRANSNVGSVGEGVNLPDFGDDEINEYIYKSFSDDYGSDWEEDIVLGLDYIGISTPGAESAKNPWLDPNGRVFKNKFFSKYVDRSDITNIVNAKRAEQEVSVDFDNKHESFEERKDVVSKEWLGVADLNAINKDVYDLFQQGKFEDGVALNKENGFHTLYNKDGKYVNWEELDEGDKSNANKENVRTISREDEEKASVMADRNQPIDLALQQIQNRHELVASIKNLKENNPDFAWDKSLGGELIDLITGSTNKDAIESSYNSNELIAGLEALSSEDPASANYNEALKKFLITGRALELNQDISKLAEEGSKYDATSVPEIALNVANFLVRPDEFAGYTADEQVEAFPTIMNDLGYEMTDDWKKTKRSGGDWLGDGGVHMYGEEVDFRDVMEVGKDFIGHIAPLIASITIAKKMPVGMKVDKLKKTLTATKTLGGEIAKKFTVGNKWLKGFHGSKSWGRVVDLSLGGAEELVYLSMADQVGGKLFDMDPMVYNPGEGGQEESFNPAFAFGLGVGNVLTKKIIQRMSVNAWGSKVLSRVNNIKIVDKVFQAGLGATGGVGAMEVAKLFSGDSEILDLTLQDVDFSKFEENGFASAADYKASVILDNNKTKAALVKQAAGDWIGMFALNLLGPNSGVMEAISKDIDNYNIKYRKTSKDSKKLGIEEGSDTNTIDKAAKEKEADVRAKIKQKKIDAEKGKKEINEIKLAALEMHGRNDIITAKKMIKNYDQKKRELERQVFVLNKRMQAGQESSGKEISDIAKMPKAEFDLLLRKMNNPYQAQALAGERAMHIKAVEYVESFANISSAKKRYKFLEETLDYLKKHSEISVLKAGNNNGTNDAKIALLKDKLKPIQEKHTESLRKLEMEMEKAVNKELLVAKKLAKSLGAEFKIAESEKEYEDRYGGEKGTAGEYINGRIVVNPKFAANAKTIGTGLHEVTHFILRDVFKKIDPKSGKRVISEEGVAVIDKFLDTLSKSDRGIIYKRLNESYRDKKSKIQLKDETYEQKKEYYEEVLTTYVEALKNKQITLDLSTGQKISNVFTPHLNKVFTNLKPATDMTDVNNLKDMLNDLYLSSERLGNVSKYELASFMKENAPKTANAFEGFAEVSNMELSKAFSKYPEMKRINATGEKYTRQEWKDGKWLEGYNEVLPDVIKVLTKKSFEANAKYPGIISDPQSFAFQVANELGGLNPNQQKIGGHVRNFDITKKTYDREGAEFGLSGWINNVADLKLLNVLKRADKIIGAKKTKSLDVEEAGELVYEGPSAIDIIETKMTNETARRIIAESDKVRIHELFTQVNRGKGVQAKEIHDGIKQKFTTEEGGIDMNKLMEFASGKNMKSLPRLVLPETVGLFVPDKALAQKIANKIEKKSNLDQADIIALQKGLDRWIPMIAEYVIPEGFITEQVKYKDKKGEERATQVPAASTGIPNKILAVTHNKRSVAGVTTADGTKVRTKKNFFGHYKKPMSVDLYENLREAIGIMKDGTRNTSPRNIKKDGVIITEGVGETLKAVVSLTEKMLTSQAVREPMYELGKIFEPEMLAIADGKPQKSFNKVKVEDLLLDIELKAVEYAMIASRTKNGERFGPLMLQEVFGKETGPMRKHLEEVYADRKGFSIEENILDLQSVEGLTAEAIKKLDKQEAVSTAKVAKDNNINPDRVSLTSVNKSVALIEQRTKHHIEVLNNLPDFRMWPKEALTSLLTELGFGSSKSRKEVLKDGGEQFGLKQTGTSKDVRERQIQTLENYYGKELLKGNGKVYEGQYDAAYVPKDFGKLKRQITVETNRLKKLVDSKDLTREQAEMNLVDFVRAKFSSTKESSGYEATVKANEALAKEFYVARFKAAKAEGTKTIMVDGEKVTVNVGLENLIVHNAMQSNHSTGITKAMVYNLEHIAFEGSKPGTYSFPNKKGKMIEYETKDELHWEHERQLLNTNEHWVNLVNRHKKVTPEMLNELDIFIETSTQSLIEKSLQLKNDAKGRTSYSDQYTGNLSESGVLNVLTRKGVERNQLVMSGPYKGKRLSEKLAGEFTMKELKDVLAKLPKELWSPEAYTVEATNLKDHKAMVESNNKAMGGVVKNYSKLKGRDQLKDLITTARATNLGRISNKKPRGMSTFDFDETVGVSDNFVIATKGKEKKRIASNEWPFVGDKLINEGWKMDFTDFNKVTKGKPGPLMQKMKNQIEKYGPENVFILTARAPESQRAIHEYLKSEGIKIPLKNVTGLGNSTGEAKAMWMLEKFAEGYNDMYFVDDALPNVKAVKEVLDQLDIKSSVQIARQFNRTKLSKSFNDILQEVEGVKSEASFSDAKGRLVGEKKGKYRFGTPGMEDFSGLVTYKFAGKGKKGEAHKKFFEDNLQKPFNRAYNEVNTRKQNIADDYKALRKAMPEVRKSLGEKVDGVYNVDQAIRVYNFNKAGYEVPGLSKTDLKKLVNHVASNPKLVAFADQLSKITMLKEGYIKPAEYWLGENITSDMNNVVDRVVRKEALSEFRENREQIFGVWKGGKIVGENMNKIEAIHGPRHREALENMLWRMENGTNRPSGADSATNKWMNWVNSATGTIMFFNQKSAALQTISSLNYVNGSFNNPLRAAQAFANQKQYWKDFAFLFNSPMMLQRRSGLKINIEAAELLERVGGKEGGYARFRAYILEKGFIPTKYADSFAIASGGASYYRNSVRKYKKQGLTEKEAEKRAFEDFAQMTEATQQSSRPDLISMQQASGLGRPILAFANTPIQMFRRHKRRLQDIANRRGNTAENVLSAVYYGFAQTMIFSYLANAMFAVDDESEDEEAIKFAESRKTRHINTIADSYLRGMGLVGATMAAIKNGVMSAIKETNKANADYGNTVIDLVNISPPIGSKLRKLYSAGKTYKYNKEVIPEMGFRIDNPAVLGVAKVISAATNLPADRVVQKLLNLKNAANSDFENWQRISMFMGLSKYAIGAKDEAFEAEVDAIEKRAKKQKKKNKNIPQVEANKQKQKQEKKDGKKVTCAAISKSGNRCKTKIEPGSSFCTVHISVKQNKGGKKVQCKKVKSNKKRCKMQTSASSGYCYYHD